MWRKSEPRPDWQIAFAITAALRVVYTGVAAVAAVVLHPDMRLVQSNAFTGNLPAAGGWHYALLGIWERFDTPWYLRISTAAAFFYFWGLLRLARSEFPNAQPLRTTMLAAAWPASFFFFAGYTEALAVALIVWCVGWAREEHWVLAAACAFAAGLTRSAGTLAMVPLAIMAWWAPRWARWPVAIAPLGTLGYWFWLHRTGRLSVATAYRTYWNTEVASPWTTLGRAIRSLAARFEPLVAISLVALIF